MRDMSRWEAVGCGGLLGAIIGAVFAAGGRTGWHAVIWLAVALTAVVSLSAAPNRHWLTRGLPVTGAIIAALAWATVGPAVLVEVVPCAACITICVAAIRHSSSEEIQS